MNLHQQSYAAAPSPGWTGWEALRTRIPEGKLPFQSQLAALEAFELRGHALIAHHPGAGKTPVGLLAARLVAGPTLVVCPPSITHQWRDRALEWGFQPAELTMVTDRVQARGLTARPGLTILADSVLDQTRPAVSFALLVVDEAHRFKSIEAYRTKKLLARGGIADYCNRVLALTATPCPNGPVELFPLLKRIAPSVCPNWSAFTSRYAPPFIRDGRECFGSANAPELNQKLRETVLHRPRKEDVLRNLPPVRWETISVTAGSSGVDERVAEDVFFRAGTPDANLEAEPFSAARRMLGLAKANASVELIKTYTEGGSRPLVMCWHKDVADAIAEALHVPAIHGGVPVEARRVHVADFIAGRHVALVATIGACGTGIDGLQNACDFMIFLERSFVPSDNEQTAGRIYRTGQQRPVRFLLIEAIDPLDRALASALRRKVSIIRSVHE